MSMLSEALTSSMVAGLDPMNAVTRQFATQMVAQQQVDLVKAKKDAIVEIDAALAKARDTGAEPATIGALEKLQAQLAAS